MSKVTSGLFVSGITLGVLGMTVACASSSDGAQRSTQTVPAVDCPPSFGDWTENTAYTRGDLVHFGAEVYRCVQSHTALSVWPPDIVPALWEPVTCSDGTGPSADGGVTPPPGTDAGPPAPESDSASDTAAPPPPTDGAPPPPPPPPGPAGDQKVIAYFAAWDVYGRNFHVTDIDASLITHLNYAFLNIAGGECVLGDSYAEIDKSYPGDTWDAGALRGSFHQLQILKSKFPKLKVLLSIGGWTWSSGFSDAAATDASRTKFANSCVALMSKYGFDGLDVDWEYPTGGGLAAGRPEDKQNYTLLLAALRGALGGDHLLTIAAPAGPTHIANLEVSKLKDYVDSINIMTYDFHGAWDLKTGHNSPLYQEKADPSPAGWSTDGAVQAYLAAGVPASKIVVGAAFYGRGWAGVPSANNGLYQSATGASPGTWEQGVLDYKDIAANYLPTFSRFVSSESKVPWIYSASRQIMITYDDAESLGVRARYVRDQKLGGVMVWELSSDDKAHTLGKALWSGLH